MDVTHGDVRSQGQLIEFHDFIEDVVYARAILWTMLSPPAQCRNHHKLVKPAVMHRPVYASIDAVENRVGKEQIGTPTDSGPHLWTVVPLQMQACPPRSCPKEAYSHNPPVSLTVSKAAAVADMELMLSATKQDP